MVRALVAAALLAVAAPAHGACDALILGGASRHGDRSQDVNERNWGLGCQQRWSRDLTTEQAAYYNTSRYYSELVTGTWTPLRLGPLELGGSAGVVKYRKWGPFGAFAARLPIPGTRWTINAFRIPSVDSGVTGVFLTLEF